MRTRIAVPAVIVAWTMVAYGCSGGDKKKNVDSEEGVQIMYDNFQPTILRITTNGLAAKGTASQGANVPEIFFPGLVQGSGTISGTVAQSSGQNENLSLDVQLDAYSDTGDVIFQTDNTSPATLLQFDLQVKNAPGDNTMDGTITGTLTLDGDVEGTGVFDLTTVTDLEDDDLNPAIICTHVTGTVTAEGDDLDVDFVLPLGLDSALQAACAAL